MPRFTFDLLFPPLLGLGGGSGRVRSGEGGDWGVGTPRAPPKRTIHRRQPPPAPPAARGCARRGGAADAAPRPHSRTTVHLRTLATTTITTLLLALRSTLLLALRSSSPVVVVGRPLCCWSWRSWRTGGSRILLHLLRTLGRDLHYGYLCVFLPPGFGGRVWRD